MRHVIGRAGAVVLLILLAACGAADEPPEYPPPPPPIPEGAVPPAPPASSPQGMQDPASPSTDPSATPAPATSAQGPLPALPSQAPQYVAPQEEAPPPATQWTATYPTGQWVYTAGYGWVWIPNDATLTAYEGVPYAYLYTPAYGWTWYVSPWGGGPYRYGVWVRHPWRGETGSPHVARGRTSGRTRWITARTSSSDRMWSWPLATFRISATSASSPLMPRELSQ